MNENLGVWEKKNTPGGAYRRADTYFVGHLVTKETLTRPQRLTGRRCTFSTILKQKAPPTLKTLIALEIWGGEQSPILSPVFDVFEFTSSAKVKEQLVDRFVLVMIPRLFFATIWGIESFSPRELRRKKKLLIIRLSTFAGSQRGVPYNLSSQEVVSSLPSNLEFNSPIFRGSYSTSFATQIENWHFNLLSCSWWCVWEHSQCHVE